MTLAPLPPSGAWRHHTVRVGVETAFFAESGDSLVLRGCTCAVENGQAWSVRYEVEVATDWTTVRAAISGISATGPSSTVLTATDGRWAVDGVSAPHLDGCLDVDLESSVVTNTLPVHRLALPTGARADAPAAYVRALSLTVERLEQTYARVEDAEGRQRYAYAAPDLDFTALLDYDESGLVLEYPGLASRF